MLDLLLDAIAPLHCAGCGALGSGLCPSCTTAIDRAPVVERRNIEGVAFVRAAGPYKGELRAAIMAFKYGNRQALGVALAGSAARKLGLLGCDLIVPVPLHEERLRRRGYNQADIIARAFAGDARRRGQVASALVASDALRRLRATPAQSRLDLAARSTNVAEAFTPGTQASHVRGRRVLLVDDVVTTGATLRACAHVLSSCGAARVIGACLAATP